MPAISRGIRRAASIAALGMTITAGLGAQSLAERVAAVGSGTVRFEFAAQEGVCGNGRGSISIRDNDRTRSVFNTDRRSEWADECDAGPVRVALDLEGRAVTSLRTYVGGRWRGAADVDLGSVDATEASRYLLRLAQTADSKAAQAAVLPAVLADAPDPWRELLDIAKDANRPSAVRKNATFWVAQAAGDKATEGLAAIIESETDRDVRKSAVFGLSQRPAGEGVPALIRVAREHRDPEIRKNAIFWLGQSRDDRALRYFEEVLLGR